MLFTKMQGLGNDYIYINCLEKAPERPSELAKRLSDRHFGVGADGLVLILPSEAADFRMRMFNADGSEAQMCGNAVRCVGKYVYDRGLTAKTELDIETAAGVKYLSLKLSGQEAGSVTVDMGKPILKPGLIPVKAGGDSFIDRPVSVGGSEYRVSCVSMGNPHAVVFLGDIDGLGLETIGPLFENHELFPERINTEFVQIIDRGNMRLRVWERGSGETLACGTGASAAVVAAVLNGKTDRQVRVGLLGGELDISWDEDSGRVFMTGPAEFVFEGELL